MSNDPTPANVDETRLTEITLQPDGRIYVFGASRDVIGLLLVLQPNDARLSALLRGAADSLSADDPPP